jgi:renalase
VTGGQGLGHQDSRSNILPKRGNKWHGADVIPDVLIIGAGIAGLSCARVLVGAGKTVRLIERSRGVGGRCATRRVDGQPVDHGLAFLHGQSPDFLEVLHDVPGRWLDPWPSVVLGTGTPCQPNAFVHGARRMAHANGINAFPKHLANGLDVVLETAVTGFELAGEDITVLAKQRGEPTSFVARDVVLALAGPQSLALLDNPISSRNIETARALLTLLPSVPCATVIALYQPENAEVPPWDIWYPETSAALLLVAHDSAKRDNPQQIALVLQARPAWSSAILSTAEGVWVPQLLGDAARSIGSWVARPGTWQAHVWHHARTSPDCELAGPLLLDLERGRRVGIAGELFARGGGVQAAWQSGKQLALRLLEEAHK